MRFARFAVSTVFVGVGVVPIGRSVSVSAPPRRDATASIQFGRVVRIDRSHQVDRKAVCMQGAGTVHSRRPENGTQSQVGAAGEEAEAKTRCKMQRGRGEVYIQLTVKSRQVRRPRHEGTQDSTHPADRTWRDALGWENFD